MRRGVGEGDGFRRRGEDVWRVEGFSDAVFAFAVTLLVVSLEVPETFDDLLRTMEGFLAFAISFALLAWIWSEHYKFFRRYGLRDMPTMWINFVLLFLVLFFVYPLKFLFTLVSETLFGFGGSEGMIESSQIPLLMVTYGAGFIAVQLVFVALYWRAYALRDDLGLDAREMLITRAEVRSFLLNILVGLTSIIFAVFGGEEWTSWAGWSYALIWPLQALNGRAVGSGLEREETEGRAEAEQEVAAGRPRSDAPNAESSGQPPEN